MVDTERTISLDEITSKKTQKVDQPEIAIDKLLNK